MPAEAEPQRGGTLQVGLADDPPELDPHLTSSNASRTVLHNIFATLVEVDAALQVVPGLAEFLGCRRGRQVLHLPPAPGRDLP
jgi:peptide/nickel transport system substrate-binding protein